MVRRRPVAASISGFVLIFGLLSVHYTNGEEIGHHVEWAEEHGLPPPC